MLFAFRKNDEWSLTDSNRGQKPTDGNGQAVLLKIYFTMFV